MFHRVLVPSVVALLAFAAPAAPAAAAGKTAPGAPGADHTWAPADKHGFGTSHQVGSHVFFTLRQASLTEVYFPDLSTPAFRGLQFAVTDGKTFLDRETVDDDPRHVEPTAPGSAHASTRSAGRSPSGRSRARVVGSSPRRGSATPPGRRCSPECASAL